MNSITSNMQQMLLPLLLVLLLDAFVVLAGWAAVVALSKRRSAMYAVFRRNFVAYFSNPTGYVFLCLFVLLSSVAAFWTHGFFGENLANLNQLSKWFPYIMLVFIPAITMSIWAEERRQGTDELLLTIPASDWDIVIGKYLASLAVYTVSLLFSQVSNYIVLNLLAIGDVDIGLIAANYLGYWFLGAAMLSIGMVASFLTNNLTVGFVMGVLFNIPLVFVGMADAIIPTREWSIWISRWSLGEQFTGFGRGVIGLSATTYFCMVVFLGLYLSSILIGRRHWVGGKDGKSLLGHYFVRALAVVAIAVGANLFFSNHDQRIDATTERVSSLSRDTKRIVKELDSIKRPVTIEAYISDPPEGYVETKTDLVNLLGEFGTNKNVTVRVYDNLEPFSEKADQAEDQYGIRPETVLTQERGALKQEQVFMGAAFTSGLEKVVVPFFDTGIPVEYELIRSIRTAAKQERKRVGVVRTDAELFGGMNMQTFQQRPRQLIVEELEKQYEVVEVDPSNPIDTSLDVLLAVQPSSLPQPQLNNLIDAVRAGVPTAIFEDPMPVILGMAPGTGEQRRPRGGGMMGMGGQPPEPKGNITELWSVLGIEMVGQPSPMGGFGAEVVWQRYNPYPKVRGFSQITDEWVFASPEAPGAENAVSESDDVTSGMREILFLYPGAIREKGSKEGFTFKPLIETGNETGEISAEELRTIMMSRDPNSEVRRAFLRNRGLTGRRYTLAARIEGPIRPEDAQVPPEEAEDDEPAADDETDGNETDGNETDAKTEAEPPKKINAIFVADIDLLSSDFLRVRQRPDPEFNWQFENVTFVLNVVDSLAGDADFLDIRKRKTRHSTLRMVDLVTAGSREEAQQQIADYSERFDEEQSKAEDGFNKRRQELQKKSEEIDEKLALDPSSSELRRQKRQLGIQLAMEVQLADARLNKAKEDLERERDKALKDIERELERKISNVQNRYKLWAAFLPVLPPLLVGLIVYVRRQSKEKEGVSRERMR